MACLHTLDFLFQGLYVVANPADEAAVKKLRKVRRQLFINLNQDEIVCTGGSAGYGQGVDLDGDSEAEARFLHDPRISALPCCAADVSIV